MFCILWVGGGEGGGKGGGVVAWGRAAERVKSELLVYAALSY